MRTRTKVWLITAASLVLIGCIMFGGVMSMLKWDFTKLSTKKYETNLYDINETFNNISIKTDTADILFALSDDGTCKVECYEEEKEKHSVTVQGDTLVIHRTKSKSWYDHIGINVGSPKIKVSLPNREYASLRIEESTGHIKLPNDFTFETVDLTSSTGMVDFYASASEMIKIKTTTGAICVKDLSAGDLDLSVSTGKVTVSGVTCEGDVTVNVSTGKTELTDITCKNVTSNGSTGDLYLNRVIATETFSIKRSTGDVIFDGSDAAEIFVKTDTGDVTGSLLSNKTFITHTDTGNVEVPKTGTGGLCEITTDTGDIKLTVKT